MSHNQHGYRRARITGSFQDVDMAFPDESIDDVFKPSGGLRTDLLSDTAAKAVDESVRMARETRWDSVRSPHVFMGLLAACDPGVRDWGKRLGADYPGSWDSFRNCFIKKKAKPRACWSSIANFSPTMSFASCAMPIPEPLKISA